MIPSPVIPEIISIIFRRGASREAPLFSLYLQADRLEICVIE